MAPPVNLAVIGGSGAYKLLADSTFGRAEDQPPVDTPFGPAADIKLINSGGPSFYFLSRHGIHGYNVAAPFVNYRANIWALKTLGVERIVSWSGPGIINPGLEVGGFAVPDDLIDMTKSRPSTFFTKGGLGFIRMSHPFCPDLRHALLYSAGRMGHHAAERATYVCTEGPRLETPAEIRLYHSYGADLVGMTLCPEAFLARELEICYAAICYLTNFAEGLADRKFTEGTLFEGMATAEERQKADVAMAKTPGIILEAMKVAHAQPRACQCQNAMLRYRKQGTIGEDWRKWIDP
jgi:5'-methylthioadenosine phosphorylase